MPPLPDCGARTPPRTAARTRAHITQTLSISGGDPPIAPQGYGVTVMLDASFGCVAVLVPQLRKPYWDPVGASAGIA